MPRFDKPLPPGLFRYWPVWIVLLAGALRLASLGDAAMSRAFQAWPAPLPPVFGWITVVGQGEWYLVPALVLAIVFAIAGLVLRPRLWKLAAAEMTSLFAFVFAAIGFAGLASNLLKRLVGRGRPLYLDTVGPFDYHHFAFTWTYESFPSGHSATIFAVAMVVGFLVPRAFYYALAVALLVGLSRIVVGMHYPTDVLGGAVCGVLVAYLVRLLFARRGWLFRQRADGTIAPPAYAATRRLRRRWREPQRPAR